MYFLDVQPLGAGSLEGTAARGLAGLGRSAQTRALVTTAAAGASFIPVVGIPLAATISVLPELLHPQTMFRSLKHDVFALFGHASHDPKCAQQLMAFQLMRMHIWETAFSLMGPYVQASRDKQVLSLWNQAAAVLQAYPVANDDRFLAGYPKHPCAVDAKHPGGGRCSKERAAARVKIISLMGAMKSRLVALGLLGGADASKAIKTALGADDALWPVESKAIGKGGRFCGHSQVDPAVSAARGQMSAALVVAAGQMRMAAASATGKSAVAGKPAGTTPKTTRAAALAAIAKAKAMGAVAARTGKKTDQQAYAAAYQQAKDLVAQVNREAQAGPTGVPRVVGVPTAGGATRVVVVPTQGAPAAAPAKKSIGAAGWLALGVSALTLMTRRG